MQATCNWTLILVEHSGPAYTADLAIFKISPRMRNQETGVARCPNKLEKSLDVIGGSSMGSGAMKFTRGSRTLYLHEEQKESSNEEPDGSTEPKNFILILNS